MNRVHGFVLGLLAVAFLNSGAAHAAAPGSEFADWDWPGLGQQFGSENQPFQAEWSKSQNWKDEFCNASLDLKGTIKGTANHVRFQLNDHGSADVYADLSNVFLRGEAKYKSLFTLCNPIPGWLGARIDRAEIWASVEFIQSKAKPETDVKVKILATKFGTIHLGEQIPSWLERDITRWINGIVREVWASRIGDYVNRELGTAFKKSMYEH